jgi:hypothetical protein
MAKNKIHNCPDCNKQCSCPTGNEGPDFCTHCAEELLGNTEEEGNYIDLSSPVEKLDDLEEENFV